MQINLSSSEFVRYGGSAWSNTSAGTEVQTYNTVGAVGQACLANFSAPGGRYDLQFHFGRNVDGAIVDIEIDGVVVATYDLYAATPGLYKPTINNLLLGDGEHYVKVTVTGHNGASTGYTCYMGYLSLNDH